MNMGVSEVRVSGGGQMTLPAEVRRRWLLIEGSSVEVADFGGALLLVPAGGGGLRGMLREAVSDSGGYGALAEQVALTEADLA